MIRPVKSLMIIACFLLSGLTFNLGSPDAYGNANKECTQTERYLDARERCLDISADDVIALGSVRVVQDGPQGARKVVLRDEERGEIDLLLTPALIQAVDESPVESYEVEGALMDGQMIVKSLRPIE